LHGVFLVNICGRPESTRWLDIGTMAVGAQCHVGCDSCSHTGNMSQNALQAGSASAAASARKTSSSPVRSPLLTCFFPVTVKTLGPLSDEAHSLIAEISREPRFAQPIRGKLRSCTKVFPWQFSVSALCALPTRSQFPSPHRNHSGHTFFANFKTLGMKYKRKK